VIRLGWQPGPEPRTPGTVVVSATRFLYRRWRHMPLVWFHGWRLRRGWGRRPGAVGLFTGVELRRPVTYSLSVWRSQDDLRRFLRAPDHVRLMRGFRSRLTTATSVTFEMGRLAPEEAWREGLRRLAAR
jgi:hypothetical protein